MHLKKFAAGALALAAASALAQFGTSPGPDWREADVPPPPPLRTSGLIGIEAPRSELKFGVDPASIVVGPDRIVRYVVVAISASGVVNGIYEGMHCKTGQVKVYARHNPPAGWTMVNEPKWVAADEGSHRTYTWQLAQGGVCLGHTPNRNATQIVRDLRAPHDSRFSTESR